MAEVRHHLGYPMHSFEDLTHDQRKAGKLARAYRNNIHNLDLCTA